ELVMPVLLLPTPALLLRTTQAGHPHDFAGALGADTVAIAALTHLEAALPEPWPTLGGEAGEGLKHG
ncbi:hypothetical protein ACFYO8_28980, partial [Micromonospora sp. NPDC005257]|uniref:hypothetical protein n=1 Tax=Micromonospora sp. NPDC005257 TaxID=3364230 RepID=UPI0036D13F05